MEERTGQLLSLTMQTYIALNSLRNHSQSLGIAGEKHFSIFSLNSIATPV